MVEIPDFSSRVRRLGIVMLDQDQTLPNARRLVIGSGLAVVDDGPGGDLTVSASGGITVVSQVLASNVAMAPSRGTWVAGLSLLLTPGTWLVHAYVTAEIIEDSFFGFNGIAAKLWDGAASEIAAGEVAQITDAAFELARHQVSLTGLVVVASNTTYTLAVKAIGDIDSGTIRATIPSGGTTAPATAIHALRIS